MSSGVFAGFDAAVDFDYEAMERDASQMLGAFMDGTRDFRVAVKIGDAAQEIVQYAAEHDVDLVMMPTHGYGPYRSFLLGSVAAKALHDLAIPVWTAAHCEDLAVPERVDYRNILCAVDLGPCTVPLLRRARMFADAFGATLRIFHAVPGAELVDRRFDTAFTNFLLDSARDEIKKIQERAGTDLAVCLASGPVASVIAEAARDHDADLVIMGRGRIHNTLGRLRTNAYAIIRESPCPVLSF